MTKKKENTTRLIGIRKMGAEFERMLRIKLFYDEEGIVYTDELNKFFERLVTEDEKTIREHFQYEQLCEFDGGVKQRAVPIEHEVNAERESVVVRVDNLPADAEYIIIEHGQPRPPYVSTAKSSKRKPKRK